MTTPRLDVVVIDDNARFALHVWRYLSRSIGFGIGDVATNGGELREFLGRPLSTPAGDACVWWVPPIDDAKTLNTLKAVQPQLRAKKKVILIDVWDPHPAESEEAPQTGEARKERPQWLKLVELVKEAGISRSNEEIKLVSSYEVPSMETRKFEFLAKTPETLDRFASTLWHSDEEGEEEGCEGSESKIHILITGAGFELSPPDDRDAISPLGIPGTGDVLRRCLSRLGLFEEDTEQPESKSWPLPLPEAYSSLESPAIEKNLDNYWNKLLELQLLDKSGIRTLETEAATRNQFRQVFLTHDWGVLNQTLDAIRLPWKAWLTTNYTRYLDRALALTAGHQPEISWNVISISSEATVLLKKILHGEINSEEPGSSHHAKRLGRDPYLFKLHGDLAHLTTMAIAGHDKEIYTPFSLPIDNLHWLYVAAQQYLTTEIGNRLRPDQKEGKGGLKVFWHIVGHSLKDRLLCRILRRVRKATAEATHLFIAVTPFEEEQTMIWDRLRTEVKVTDAELDYGNYSAEAWLAKLSKNRLTEPPPSGSQPR